MSKTDSKKKRGTRLKGTDTKKPCVDCGKTKDRFKSFRPRWAGCATHRSENGRRYFQAGCADCTSLVNGNIRQPRCIDCDAQRPKKRKGDEDPTPTPTVETPEDAANPDETTEDRTVLPEDPKVGDLVESPEDGEDAVAPIQAVVVAAPLATAVTVEAQDEPAPESVSLPEPQAAKPAPRPVVVDKRPAIASMADLSKLFDTDQEVSGE